MSIEYDYTVLSVDGAQKSMAVRYASEGRDSIVATIPMPDAGESLGAAVARFAPVASWEAAERAVEAVLPGAAGSLTTPTVSIITGMPFSQFYGLFTNAEKDALVGATQTDVQTKRRYDELLMLNMVSTALPEVEMLLSQLVAIAALTGARKTEILAAMA